MYFIFDAHETFNNGEVVLQDMRILSFCGSEHFNKDSFQKWSSDEKQDHTKLIFVIVMIAKKTPWRIFASQQVNRRRWLQNDFLGIQTLQKEWIL